MDLQMPEMNGFEATRFIRDKMNSQIPIIALTADVTTVDLEKCKAVGMNDYISKPVDERLLYNKIIDLFKEPLPPQDNANIEKKDIQAIPHLSRSKCVDLTYLYKRTKANPELMMEMISIYLEQTPSLVSRMKQSLLDEDWGSLYTAVHKMIPSFSIMGIHKDFENMAQRIQECAGTKQHLDEVKSLVLQLETICSQACGELKEEYNLINKIIK